MSEVAEPAGSEPGPSAAPPESGGARQGPYGPIPPGARLTWGWASVPVQLLLYCLSILPAFLVTTVIVIIQTAGSAEPPTPADLELPVLVTLLALQFPMWGLLVLLWVRGFERRSLASAGLQGPNALPRYFVGLAAGVGVAMILMALSTLVAPQDLPEVDPEAMDFSRLLEREWIVLFVGVVALFLVQSACEEIAFRGWMMSVVAARWGMAAGVLLNIVVFGLLHVQVFASGATAGAVAILAITCVGLFLSLWAIAERSVIGVCGVHGGFNVTLMCLGLAAMGASDPDATPGQVLLDTIKQQTAMDGQGSVAGGLLQLIVFAALSGLMWLGVRNRR